MPVCEKRKAKYLHTKLELHRKITTLHYYVHFTIKVNYLLRINTYLVFTLRQKINSSRCIYCAAVANKEYSNTIQVNRIIKQVLMNI